ncbi:FAD-dependent oxidoreductase [Microbacterium telephonicum]|uniref:Ferredoxin-NADP reductase n=1 Tax=Microbacterium telephonicum TaxID=1714841 RepID=A0A498C9G6_9MICO|nr:flavodoxin reductase [Microbacterium telephonicum]RLK48971.1 ferredoxin-NADP reductase [Microbacterium telephonicum]
MSSLTAVWNRVYAVLGRFSMYRLVVFALAALGVVALLLSLGGLVAPTPLELLATAAVLSAACAATDVVAHRLLGRQWRWESSLITALILLFVLRPTLEPWGLVGAAIGGIVASASKYLLAWQGRHVFNPAAVGAAAVTILGIWLPDLGYSAWWVGAPALAAPVIITGLIVLMRTEKVRVIAVFLVIAVAVSFLRVSVQTQAAGLELDSGQVFWQLLWSSPFLFLGAFMLSEPLTLPPRRWQQFTVAAVVGVLAGWPIDLGAISLGQERALLIGNLVAFAFTIRTAVRLRFEDRLVLTPTVRELVFRAERGFRFTAGQYLELEVPHPHPDARGTRREFSIVSAPEELPTVKIALREGSQSSYKKALALVEPGERLSVTGVWGDFVLPASKTAPVLMVAAGIGVTPFVSQLRHLRLAGQDRDVVFVYVAGDAEELAFRDDLEAAGIPVIVFTRNAPSALPRGWHWAKGVRLDADGLLEVVPDIGSRHAYISGPPGLIADLAPALEKARSLTTDAFSGY